MELLLIYAPCPRFSPLKEEGRRERAATSRSAMRIQNMLSPLLIDRKYRLARIWSNRELKKFAHLFQGDILNVSGWKDEDKEGRRYREYFANAERYFISNYKKEIMGLQGMEGEFYLDLAADLDRQYENRFDVAFNHTTLEHIYEVRKAFANLCLLSKDTVILVVPFMQQMHGDYGDYWRFTPLTIKKLFEENGFTLLYLTFNHHWRASVYIFAIASKRPEAWRDRIQNTFSFESPNAFGDRFESYIGCRAIPNSLLFRILARF